MPTLTVTKNYADDSALTQALLDESFGSIETFVNSTKLSSDNIADGGVSSTNLASAAVTSAKIQAGAVGTSALADASVTGAKLDSGIVDNSTIALSSNQLIVKSGGITATQLTSNISLPGTQVQANSKNLVVQRSNTSTNLGVLRGFVSAAGSASVGEGFSVNRSSTGVYDVTVSSAFASSPVVVATLDFTLAGGNLSCVVSVSSASAFTVKTYSNGTLSNSGFNFIAMAPV